MTTTSLPPGERGLGFEVVTGSRREGRQEESKGSKKLTFLLTLDSLCFFAVAGA